MTEKDGNRARLRIRRSNIQFAVPVHIANRQLANLVVSEPVCHRVVNDFRPEGRVAVAKQHRAGDDEVQDSVSVHVPDEDSAWDGTRRDFDSGTKRAVTVPAKHGDAARVGTGGYHVEVAITVKIPDGNPGWASSSAERATNTTEGAFAVAQECGYTRGYGIGTVVDRHQKIRPPVAVEITAGNALRVVARGELQVRTESAIPVAEQYRDRSQPVNRRKVGLSIAVKVADRASAGRADGGQFRRPECSVAASWKYRDTAIARAKRKSSV